MHIFSVGDKVKLNMKWLEDVWDKNFPGIFRKSSLFKDIVFTISHIDPSYSNIHPQSVRLLEKDIERKLTDSINPKMQAMRGWVAIWFIPVGKNNGCFVLDVME